MERYYQSSSVKRQRGRFGWDGINQLVKFWIKYSKNGDSVSYRIQGGDYYHKASKVFRDTLYLYKNDRHTPSNYIGWFRVNKTSWVKLGLGYFGQEPLDSTKTKHLYGAVYRWEQGKLMKFSSYLINSEDLFKQKGIYYIPPPGIGIRYKFSLKELTDKLTASKGKWNAPGSL